MGRLLSAVLSVVILSLVPWTPAPAATAAEYGSLASQKRGGSLANQRSGEIGRSQSKPKKKKAKR